MQVSRCALVDSYKSARGALKPLFAIGRRRGPAQTHRDVSRYIFARSRHLERLSAAQQRSWVRANISLVLEEARRQRHYEVAEAAVRVALASPDVVEVVDPAWLKDAAAACCTPRELARLQSLLAAHPARLSALRGGENGSIKSTGSEGRMLAVLLGGSAEPVAKLSSLTAAAQLGDGDGEEALDTFADTDSGGAARGISGDRPALMARLGSENVGKALTSAIAPSRPQPQPLSDKAVAALGSSGVTLSAVRRLESQRVAAVVPPNPSFARYFLRQGIVRSEPELLSMLSAMRARPAEIGFRVHLSHPYGRAACRLLVGREGIAPVDWLPMSSGAYTLQCCNTAALPANRALLRALAKERVISYQATSSMLPVLLLDPRAGERVLDLCASPGSKSTLLLDMMMTSASASSAASAMATGDTPQRAGCVVANEADPARARELAARLQNYGPQALVTQSRGETFALASFTAAVTATESSALTAGGVPMENSFDKVLVDAPCTGEGRMGRDVMAWRLWHPQRCLSFFPRQRSLLRRAVELCRPGGTVVYATCTLNPIENEAVVAAILRELGEFVEPVAPPPLRRTTRHDTELDFLTRGRSAPLTPLLTSNAEASRLLALDEPLCGWLVPKDSGSFYHSVAEVVAQGSAEAPLLIAASFPDDTLTVADKDHSGAAVSGPYHSPVAVAAALRRCCRRVLPHHNGDGSEGFFVAVLRKTRSTHRAVVSRLAAQSAKSVRVERRDPCMSAPSLLHARGLARLPAASSRVRRLLGPFFASAAAADTHADAAATAALITGRPTRDLEAFLCGPGLVPLWRDAEGLRLVSTAAAEVAKALPAVVVAAEAARVTGGHMIGGADRDSFDGERDERSNASLLDVGVLAFTATGELTERGAVLLRPFASSRVLSLPLLHVQLLLTNRQLDVHAGEAAADPVAAALRETSSGLVGSGRRSSQVSSAWVRRVLSELRAGGPGNAIVVVDRTSSLFSTAPAALTAPHGEDAWVGLTGQWALPVRVEVRAPLAANGASGAVRLHLQLSREARQRVAAMIGRLQGHERGCPRRELIAAHAREGAEQRVSVVMAGADLFGQPISTAAQTARLFTGTPGGVGVAVSDQTAAARRVGPSDVFEF